MKKNISEYETFQIKEAILTPKDGAPKSKAYVNNISFYIEKEEFSIEKISSIYRAINAIEKSTGIIFEETTKQDINVAEENKSKLFFRRETEAESNSDTKLGNDLAGHKPDIVSGNIDGYYYIKNGIIRTSYTISEGYENPRHTKIFIHEILHFMGLNHPGNYNGEGATETEKVYDYESEFYSVMSYFSSPSGIPISLMPSDIMALHDLYGANTNINSGDTTYDEYLLPSSGKSYTIVDSLGIDTIKTSDAKSKTADGKFLGIFKTDIGNNKEISVHQVINLEQGGISSVGGWKDNLFINLKWEKTENLLTLIQETVIENTETGDTNDIIYGNKEDNLLYAGNGRNRIEAGEGDDVLTGGFNEDTLYGGDGNDILMSHLGGTVGDTLYGGKDIDVLIGSSGNDLLDGGSEEDFLLGYLGQDTLTGGDGPDTFAIVDGLTNTVTITDMKQEDGDSLEIEATMLFGNLHLDDPETTSAYKIYKAIVDYIREIEDPNTTPQRMQQLLAAPPDNYNEHFTTSLAQNISNNSAFGLSLGGAELVTPSDGGTFIKLKDGAYIFLQGITSRSEFSALNIQITTNNIEDSLNEGLSELELIQGTMPIDHIDEFISTNGEHKIIDQLSGEDNTITMSLNDGNGNDHVFIRTGNGFVYALAGHDLVMGGVANEDGDGYVFETALSTTAPLALTFDGGEGNDTLVGSRGDDTLLGGEGDDTLITNGGSDSLNGGDGHDTLQVATIGTDAAPDPLLAGATLPTSSSHTLNGAGGDDTLLGGTDADHLIGGSGHDVLVSGGGADTLEGGTGNDRLTVALAEDRTGGIPPEGTPPENVNDPVPDGAWDAIAPGSADEAAVALYGGDGDDTLVGGALGDTLLGGSGNDVLVSGGGADTMEGGEGNDLLTVAPTADLLDGAPVPTGTGDVAATLHGGDGDDTLVGGALGDTLDGGYGDDRMVGGDGDDTYLVDSDLDTIVETNEGALNGGIDTVHATVAEAILGAHVENLILVGQGSDNGLGNALANTITGNANDNTLTGLDGADTLLGLSGDDTLDGGEGNDVLDGGDGDDVLDGGTGDDALTGGAGNDHLASGGGSDTLDGGEGNDVLTTTPSTNGIATSTNLWGGAGSDFLSGGSLGDTLDGGTGADTMEGGAGDDTYTVDNLLDVVVETNVGPDAGGTDTVRTALSGLALGANVEHLTLTASGAGTGNALHNTLTGHTGADSLSGLNGNDSLVGLDGNDTLDGGNGDDSLSGGVGDDHLNGGSGNDSLTGGTGNDHILGGEGDDNMVGGDGDDTLLGGTGFDTMWGGNGNDVLDARSESTGFQVTLYGGTGNDTLYGTKESDSLFGGEHDDSVVGSIGQDDIFGGSDNDTLHGQGSDDLIDGGAGIDNLWGGSGNDLFVLKGFTEYGTGEVINGGDGVDELRFTGETAGTLVLGAGTEVERIVLGTGTETAPVLTGTTNIHLDASALSQATTLLGNAGANQLTGGTGSDTIDGGAGNDALFGGTGNESLTGGDGNDTLDGGAWADVLFGGNQNDSLLGGASNDSLFGGTGLDTLTGGTGNDQITGGDGADRFVFGTTANAGATGSDTVLDFTRAQADKLAFDTTAFAPGTTLAQILANHTTVSGGGTTITFDGGSVRVDGVTDLAVGDLVFL
jgi:Ca2+-binding RTX toxin-like protein